MAAVASAALKGYFNLGDIPSESNFIDLIDSIVLQDANADATIGRNLTVTGELNHDGTKIGFFGTAPVVQGADTTAALTAITHTAPGTPDYALQNLVQNTGFGFVTADEGNTVLKVILNLQIRVGELEAIIAAYGLSA